MFRFSLMSVRRNHGRSHWFDAATLFDSCASRRSRAGSLTLLLGAMLVACGTERAEAPVEIRIEDATGAPVASFYAFWGGESGPVRTRTCPEEPPTDAWSCAATGLTLRHTISEAELTLKSPSKRFETLRVDAIEDGTVVLGELPTFERTATYASGATRGDLETLSALAANYTTELGPTSMIKFYIADLDTEPKLYLQNTRLFPTHFEFAQKVLGVASTPGAFAAQTYQGEARKAMAGTISYIPELTVVPRGQATPITAPLLLEFFPSDDLSPNLVLVAHRLIEERFGAVALVGGSRRLLYVPAGDRQENDAASAAQRLARNGVSWATAADLYTGVDEQILNPGLAYGTLRRLTPTELGKSVVSFRDVLVLTRLPNDLPVVGGTITEELQTPLAHVNLLAKARQTPNLALKGASDDERV
ncbi:MAG TPA: hypothetical protein VIV60_14535, partial [Polyangiaceae bacterium]